MAKTDTIFAFIIRKFYFFGIFKIRSIDDVIYDYFKIDTVVIVNMLVWEPKHRWGKRQTILVRNRHDGENDTVGDHYTSRENATNLCKNGGGIVTVPTFAIIETLFFQRF